jgi:hypothetical protein
MKGVVVEPVRIDSCGAPITIQAEVQLDLDNTLYFSHKSRYHWTSSEEDQDGQ